MIEMGNFVQRFLHFLKKPWSAKKKSLRYRFKLVWNLVFPFLPLPVRLPFGAWFLAWSDLFGDGIFFSCDHEPAERSFVESFVKRGMTAIDIGAHQGFYTLLLSLKVGPEGKVIAFEPSPRELKKLMWNLRINRCRNVRVEPFALGRRSETAELFVVPNRFSGLDSLRPPKVKEVLRSVKVQVRSLDEYLSEGSIASVDFVKIDAEGAELEILKGAQRLLTQIPRPILLVEVSDTRTEPWNYKAKEIVDYLRNCGFLWFSFIESGGLKPLSPDLDIFNGNFLAVPEERLDKIATFVTNQVLKR